MLEVRVRSVPRASIVWFAERASIPTTLAGLTTAHLFYNQVAEKPETDVAARASVSEFATLLIDLTASEEELWEAIRKKTRGYIRAAESIGHELEWFHADNDRRFYEFIASFFARKQFATVPPRELYEKYLENGAISCCSTDGAIQVVHFYLVDRTIGRTRLVWSARAAEETQDVARLNRLLHWKDLLYFKHVMKLTTYDWGGVSLGEGPVKGVDDFKRRFGGTVVTEWNVQWHSRFYSRVRQALSRPAETPVSDER